MSSIISGTSGPFSSPTKASRRGIITLPIPNSFDKVLLAVNDATTIGAPAVSGVKVEAEILDHLKADKVIVFKKKRRKGYKVKNGHRQALTRIQITGISGL